MVSSFGGADAGTGVGPDPVVAGRFEKEKSSAKKEKDIPPRSALVEQFFAGQGSTAAEASRFINHYTANGWLVGGKSPMIDWRAPARNWITNSLNFNGHGKYPSGYDMIHRYSRGKLYGSEARQYCFDDLGIENNIKYYAIECNVMAEILLTRYDLFVSKRVLRGKLTNFPGREQV